MNNCVKVTGTAPKENFGSLEPGDLFSLDTEADTTDLWMRTDQYKQAIELTTGQQVNFKNSREVYRVRGPQGVHIRARR